MPPARLDVPGGGSGAVTARYSLQQTSGARDEQFWPQAPAYERTRHLHLIQRQRSLCLIPLGRVFFLCTNKCWNEILAQPGKPQGKP